MTDQDQQKPAATEDTSAGGLGLSQSELDELVAASDTGARGSQGGIGLFIALVALAWSLFQLWIASPIPFMVGFGVFNDTEARSIHLAFAIFLAFAAFPASRTPVQLWLGIAVPVILGLLFYVSAKEGTSVWWIPLVSLAVVGAILLGSPKDRIPPWEWALAVVGAASALYLYVYYKDISSRVGAPIMQDFVVSVIGILILLEATRRALGPALMIVASVFLVYTVLGVLISALAGYAFAKFRFRGRETIFFVLLLAIIIPYHVTLVPLFQLMNELGWINTFQAVILPNLAFPFGIFLMRQNMAQIPNDLLDAARVDGGGELRIFWSVALPTMRPALAALAIFMFTFQWNNFLWPLIVLRTGDMYTLPVALSSLIGLQRIDYGQLMMGTFLSVLPIIVFFLLLQRQFISGILGGAVKG